MDKLDFIKTKERVYQKTIIKTVKMYSVFWQKLTGKK